LWVKFVLSNSELARKVFQIELASHKLLYSSVNEVNHESNQRRPILVNADG